MAHRLATAADLLALPEDSRAEVVRGMIVEKAAPSFEHSGAQTALAAALFGPFGRGLGGPGGWWIRTEVDIELERHEIYRPDIAGWRRERISEHPGRPVRVAPDWICEVLSPSNSTRDLGPKLVTYHRAGIPHYWVLDTEHESSLVFRAAADGYILALTAGRDESVRAPPFEAIEIKVGELFGH